MSYFPLAFPSAMASQVQGIRSFFGKCGNALHATTTVSFTLWWLQTRKHTYIQTSRRTDAQPHTHTHIYKHTAMRTHKHTHIQTYIQACIHASTHTNTQNRHTFRHTNMPTYIPTYIHTDYSHTNIQTSRHTHIQIQGQCLSLRENVCLFVRLYVDVIVFVHVCMCVCVCLCVCVYVCMCVWEINLMCFVLCLRTQYAHQMKFSRPSGPMLRGIHTTKRWIRPSVPKQSKTQPNNLGRITSVSYPKFRPMYM